LGKEITQRKEEKQVHDDSITVLLRLPELRVRDQEETDYGIRVQVEYRVREVQCPGCGERTERVHSRRVQVKRDLRLWQKPVYLELCKRRFRCHECGKVFSEPDPVCGMRRRTSERFRGYLGREAIDHTVRRVARKEGVGETLVRGCVTEETRKLLGARASPHPARVLGLDEFSIRKGQVYDTAIVDLERRDIIGVVSGHRQQEVADFFTDLPHADEARVVVMDMHEAFRQAVALCLPRARVVVDKFHVLLHVHRALDQARTAIEPRQGKRGELFRARYLLLKGQERLTPESRARLMALLRRYPQLHRAWLLKESFRVWYRCTSRQEAEARLIQWEQSVREQGPVQFRALFPMLRLWREEILNYFDFPYTNGFLEGKNNRIKVIKRVAYGYRNPTNFRQRILLSNRKEAQPRAA
jgi:transposase